MTSVTHRLCDGRGGFRAITDIFIVPQVETFPCVLVIGLTGAGKTSLINLANNGDVEPPSRSSSTTTVDAYIMPHINTILIDTPGVLDTELNDQSQGDLIKRVFQTLARSCYRMNAVLVVADLSARISTRAMSWTTAMVAGAADLVGGHRTYYAATKISSRHVDGDGFRSYIADKRRPGGTAHFYEARIGMRHSGWLPFDDEPPTAIRNVIYISAESDEGDVAFKPLPDEWVAYWLNNLRSGRYPDCSEWRSMFSSDSGQW